MILTDYKRSSRNSEFTWNNKPMMRMLNGYWRVSRRQMGDFRTSLVRRFSSKRSLTRSRNSTPHYRLSTKSSQTNSPLRGSSSSTSSIIGGRRNMKWSSRSWPFDMRKRSTFLGSSWNQSKRSISTWACKIVRKWPPGTRPWPWKVKIKGTSGWILYLMWPRIPLNCTTWRTF